MEHYSVVIDSEISSKEQLFARWTDTIYLGYSGISNWDAFRELMLECFEDRQIFVYAEHRNLSGLNKLDLKHYRELLAEIKSETVGKLRVSENSDQP